MRVKAVLFPAFGFTDRVWLPSLTFRITPAKDASGESARTPGGRDKGAVHTGATWRHVLRHAGLGSASGAMRLATVPGRSRYKMRCGVL
jgi:hypothetical protein